MRFTGARPDDQQIDLRCGDSLEVLRAVATASVDAVVTDPPYGLGEPPPVLDLLRAWFPGKGFAAKGRGFMGKEWDAFVPSPDLWREVFRVLKPGGHLLAFFGTRTYDLGVLALRISGFEVRDEIAWLYGQGFPKSLDVSKAIDKAAGAERQVIGQGGSSCPDIARGETCRCVERYGEGDNMSGFIKHVPATAPATPEAARWSGWGTALKPAHEPIVVARKPLAGTVEANVRRYGTGAINVDGCRIAGVKPQVTQGVNSNPSSYAVAKERRLSGDPDEGRWPANVALDEEAAALLDEQSGERSSGARAEGVRSGLGYHGADGDGGPALVASKGGASRFFYCAKARGERSRAGVAHPTVKPIDLMRWLVRLVTPPGGLVLDPFLGSGTTAIACFEEGARCLGIERDRGYFDLARERVRRRMILKTCHP